MDKHNSKKIILTELTAVFGFPVPLDTSILAIMDGDVNVDVVQLKEAFAARDKDYDPANNTYRGCPNVTDSQYVYLRYGKAAGKLYDKLWDEKN